MQKQQQVNTAAQRYLGHACSIIFMQVDQLKKEVEQLKLEVAWLQDEEQQHVQQQSDVSSADTCLHAQGHLRYLS